MNTLIVCPNHIVVLRSHPFNEKANPGSVWNARKNGFTFSQKDGVSAQTLLNWANGEPASREAIRRLCDFINTHLIVLKGPIEPKDFVGEGSLERLCAKIGYADEDKKIQEYARIFAIRGPQTAFLYTAAEARAFAKDHRGFYHIYRAQKMNRPGNSGGYLV